MTDPEVNGNLIHNNLMSSTSVEDLSEYTDADESISAPTEILAEFLSSIMMKDYKNALKYCQAILSYEPNNSTAQEFYPLIVEKLERMQNEEESDESSSDSSELSSCSSTSSNSSSVGGSKKCSDSEDTSGSFTSLEDDTEDDKNKTFSAQSFPLLPMDLRNGNMNNIQENISFPTISNNISKKPVEDIRKFDQIQKNAEERKSISSVQNILIHPTETRTIQCNDSRILPRTRTYVKNISSELENEISIVDASPPEKQNKIKNSTQNSNLKKNKGTKKNKPSRTPLNCAKKI